MIRRPPRSTLSSSSAASDVYKRQGKGVRRCARNRIERVGHPQRDDGRGALPWFDRAPLSEGDSHGTGTQARGVRRNRLLVVLTLRAGEPPLKAGDPTDP